MRSKLHFEVHGSNLTELKRRALQIIGELIQVTDLSEIESKVELEMEIKVDRVVDKNDQGLVESFIAEVWAKLR